MKCRPFHIETVTENPMLIVLKSVPFGTVPFSGRPFLLPAAVLNTDLSGHLPVFLHEAEIDIAFQFPRPGTV